MSDETRGTSRVPDPSSSEAKPYSKDAQLSRGTPRYRRVIASPKRWQAIVAAKGSSCRICGGAFWAVEYHHLVARVHGGDDVEDNIVPLCRIDHAFVTARRTAQCRKLLARLSESERGYLLRKGGPDYPLRAYGVELPAVQS